MVLGDALKEMIHRRGLTQKKLAEAAGYKTVSVVSTPIKANDMNVSTLIKLANIAGYDLMLVTREIDPMNKEYPIRIDAKADK